MSDTTGTPDQQASGTTFTSHELLYMLALNPSDAASITREQLRLGEPVEPGTRLYAAGATTLRVRDMLTRNGEELEPSQQVQAITGILTKADTWVELGLVSTDKVEGALIVTAAGFACILTAHELGIFTVQPLQSADVVADVTAYVVRSFLERYPPAAASVNVIDGDDKRRGVVHRDEHGAWAIGTDPVQENGDLTRVDIEDSEVDGFVRSVVDPGSLPPESS